MVEGQSAGRQDPPGCERQWVPQPGAGIHQKERRDTAHADPRRKEQSAWRVQASLSAGVWDCLQLPFIGGEDLKSTETEMD